jgi:hypothetical protein
MQMIMTSPASPAGLRYFAQKSNNRFSREVIVDWMKQSRAGSAMFSFCCILVLAAQAPVFADNVWTGTNTTGATNRTGVVSVGTTNAPGTNSVLQINGGAAVGYSATTNVTANGLMVSGNVGIGISPGYKLDVSGSMSIRDNDLFFRNDVNHGLGWYGTSKLWNSVAVDGPVLYGYTGGILGVNHSGTRSNVLYWNTTGVGIGTTSLSRQFVISGISPTFEMIKTNATANQGRWTIDAGTTNGTLFFQTMNDAENSGVTWLQVVRSGTTITNLSIPNGNVCIGTTNPGTYKLAVKGKIGAQEVVVTKTGWSDFVFKDDYKLKPLDKVAEYVKKNKHLEGIPTESEVKKNGVSVGDMQAKLLQKLEENTLYLIQMKKENDELKAKVCALEKSVRGK